MTSIENGLMTSGRSSGDLADRLHDQVLSQSWTMLELLERLSPAEADALLAQDMRDEEDLARRTLERLGPWDGLPATSHRVYTGARNQVRIRRVLDFLQAQERILDVGIGYGYLTTVLMRTGRVAEYCGIDLTERFIDTTRRGLEQHELQSDRVHLAVMDLYDLTADWVRPHRPSLVLLLEVLEHVQDTRRALEVIADAVDPSAAILFSVPMYGRLEGVWGHASLFDAGRIRRLCAQAGLTIHHVEQMHNTWVLVVASRSRVVPARVLALTAPARHEDEHEGGSTVDGYLFRSVEFALPSTQYLRRGSPRRARTRVKVARRSVRCEVSRSPNIPPGPQQGGVGFEATAPSVLRLQLSFESPDRIAAVHVHGLDGDGAPAGRWIWRTTSALPASSAPQTFVLRPEARGRFRAHGAVDTARIQRIEVFVELHEAADEAAFTLHRAAYVSNAAAPGAPA